MSQSPWRLLTLNCHEAWVHQLHALPCQLDIIDGLPGRYTPQWDSRIRPLPANARLLTLQQALTEGRAYHCIIAHSMTDLLDVKSLPWPRILVLHNTLEGRLQGQEQSSAEQVRAVLRQYVRLTGTHVIAVTAMKGRSWGFTKDIVACGVDVAAYPAWSGELACGIRVANQIHPKRTLLNWQFHEEAFADLPVRLVGHNPEFPGVAPADNWDHLKSLLQSHRFYIHTADQQQEDGYNMAVLEAMAAGLPVLGNRHHSSPIIDGVSGYLSDDPQELAQRARELLADRELALRMGAAARRTVQEKFSLQRFATRLQQAINSARGNKGRASTS
ncbi:glycosyltransferase family 4 protein [Candidatus Magnetaquicoccus inordinatus]|uniref:glycosyltransferase family 4 protein n=1 Tax=Candidatus Magnetaquicoccus inordinatus TaxID=2496818 RepID=UPI00102BC848|nr:glycosyltransferase [Candidatus Magnetaquicoccus inordinatus]